MLDINGYDHGGWKVVVVAGVLIVMLFIMAIGRLASRNLKKSSIQKDDVMVIVATVLTFGLCAIAIACPRTGGLSPDVTTTTNPSTSTTSSNSSPSELNANPTAKKVFLAWTLLYGLALAASKWSILLLYLRVFTTSDRWFIVVLVAMGVLVTGTAVGNTFGIVFACGGDVTEFWRGGDGAEPNRCIEVEKFNEWIAVPNVVSGVVMLLMPLPSVFRLNISTVQKVGLGATFFHGVIGVIASIARLCVLASPSSTAPTDLTIWLLNEPTNYIIAACLPTLRPLLRLVLPDRFFVLSNPRPRSSVSKPYTTTFKLSWSRGSIVPRMGWERERFVRAGGVVVGGSGGGGGGSGFGLGGGGEGADAGVGGGGGTLLESPKRSTWNLNVFGGGGGGAAGKKVGGRNGVIESGARSPKEGVTVREESLGSRGESGPSTRQGSTTVVRFEDLGVGGLSSVGRSREGSGCEGKGGKEGRTVIDLEK